MSRCPHLDKILGLNEPISRRDFLDGALVASAELLVAGVCPFPLGAQATNLASHLAGRVWSSACNGSEASLTEVVSTNR